MAVEVFTSFGQQCDANGVPMSGAKIYVYDVNSTTPKNVYSDKDLGVSAANPIECDAYGRHDMRYVATGSYKLVIKTSAGTTVYTRDNIDGRVPVGSGALAIANGGTGATSAGAALSALGAATAAELADVTAEVASISGSLASTEKTHIATGTTAQRPATPVEGDIRRNSTTGNYEGTDETGTWKYFITEENIAAQVFVAANMPAGSVVNSTVGTYATNADLTTAIPADDTIPQNTEGTQIISVSHTPASTTNKLRIRFTGQAAGAGAGYQIAAAIFKNSTADAIAATAVNGGASGEMQPLSIQCEYTPGSTSAQTISVRVGAGSGTIRMNGGPSTRAYGGASAACLIVEEIKA